jgi:hypothetical protein
MTFLVLGSALALFPGVRFTNSVCGLPQVTGLLSSIRRADPLIVALRVNSPAGPLECRDFDPPLHYSRLFFHRLPLPQLS